MIKTLICSLSLMALSLSGIAQNPALNCGNGRYVNDVFENYTKTTGIQYGVNTYRTYFNNQNPSITLRLDFYEPQGDAATKRPLIIMAHGGSFISGNRSDLDTICRKLVRKGYTVASIDYRLIHPFDVFTVYGSQTYLADVIIKASADMKAAIRFFRRDAATANTYKVDPTKIFVGGYSAGAITALQTAYTDDVNENPTVTTQYTANGGFEGNTDLPAPNNALPTYNANGIAGVFNIAGAVADLNIVDAINPPIYSVHGDNDQTVPYNSGNGSYSPFLLYGSNAIKDRADQIGLNNQLFTIGNGVHSTPFSDNYYITIMADQAAAFFQPIVCSNIILPITLKSFSAKVNGCAALLHWETATEKNSNAFEIEISTNGTAYSKIASVRSKNEALGSGYSYNYQGVAGNYYFRLKMIDQDGSHTYSQVQNVRLVCNSTHVQVYPNPAYEQATISGLTSGMQVSIYNAEGKLVQTQKANTDVLKMPLQFANGLYLVQVKDVDGTVLNNTKLIKK